VGAHFAELARLEDASVHAFERLGRELSEAGAPARLVARARAAAQDEVRHHRVMTELARKFGAVPRRARVTSVGPRKLEAIARENAVEGCVREAFGAVVAAFQARHAADGAVRRSMRAVARDEARHAALAFAVDRWIHGRLSNAARGRVGRARLRALASLRRELRGESSSEIGDTLGWPTGVRARTLLDALTSALAADREARA
jgi:hypothetical protein